MEKIKEAFKNFFSAIGGYILLALGAVVGILVYLLVRKSEQLNSANAKLQLANTQKEVDLIEVEIKQKMQERNVTKKELDDLQKALDLVAQKRQSLNDTNTDKEVEEYWNKKMTELERLAAKAFERYSQLTTGKKASWAYLADERKQAWMKEVIFFMEIVSTSLKTKFKAPPKVNDLGGSYAAGFNSGMTTERLSTINFIEMLDTEYKDQFEQYKQIQVEKRRGR